MKAILISLFLVTLAQAQFAWLWGGADELEWGKTFKNSNSLDIRSTVTTIDSSDTVYCSMIQVSSEARGTMNVAVSWDSVDAASDSLVLQARFHYNQNIQDGQAGPWGAWKNIGTYHSTATLYVYQIADSSWWAPSGGMQFRSYRRDAAVDTCSVPKMSIYSN